MGHEIQRSLNTSSVRNLFIFQFLTHSYNFFWAQQPPGAKASSFARFLDHTQRSITVGRTPLDGRSACRSDLHLTTTHDTHNRKTSMPPAVFESAVSAGERPQTDALECAAVHWDLHGTFFFSPKLAFKDCYNLRDSKLEISNT